MGKQLSRPIPHIAISVLLGGCSIAGSPGSSQMQDDMSAERLRKFQTFSYAPGPARKAGGTAPEPGALSPAGTADATGSLHPAAVCGNRPGVWAGKLRLHGTGIQIDLEKVDPAYITQFISELPPDVGSLGEADLGKFLTLAPRDNEAVVCVPRSGGGVSGKIRDVQFDPEPREHWFDLSGTSESRPREGVFNLTLALNRRTSPKELLSALLPPKLGEVESIRKRVGELKDPTLVVDYRLPEFHAALNRESKGDIILQLKGFEDAVPPDAVKGVGTARVDDVYTPGEEAEKIAEKEAEAPALPGGSAQAVPAPSPPAAQAGPGAASPGPPSSPPAGTGSRASRARRNAPPPYASDEDPARHAPGDRAQREGNAPRRAQNLNPWPPPKAFENPPRRLPAIRKLCRSAGYWAVVPFYGEMAVPREIGSRLGEMMAELKVETEQGYIVEFDDFPRQNFGKVNPLAYETFAKPGVGKLFLEILKRQTDPSVYTAALCLDRAPPFAAGGKTRVGILGAICSHNEETCTGAGGEWHLLSPRSSAWIERVTVDGYPVFQVRAVAAKMNTRLTNHAGLLRQILPGTVDLEKLFGVRRPYYNLVTLSGLLEFGAALPGETGAFKAHFSGKARSEFPYVPAFHMIAYEAAHDPAAASEKRGALYQPAEGRITVRDRGVGVPARTARR